ncbi:hypothetical protein [Streptomyces guryensis]|uniref:Uncharacterized protein n=1 Tax=Streptomyces guryensis TaxID=2886947 RepID=A0A9Q3VUY5_9ACTN|nr:hypothetical protein [Streptomyces guryensis]MCD9880473.1 hypothetical protein [Streptomyces guryensis]
MPHQWIGDRDAGVEFQAVAFGVAQDQVRGGAAELAHADQGVRTDHTATGRAACHGPARACCDPGREQDGR